MDGAAQGTTRRLAVYFAILAAIAAVAAVFVFSAGADEHAEKGIAGGYDVTVPNRCLGAAGQQFDVKQSGRFVKIEHTGAGPSGKLDLRDGRLTGDVECVKGGSGAI